jgi:formylglycine-generating enzyme required for sulfatase activity
MLRFTLLLVTSLLVALRLVAAEPKPGEERDFEIAKGVTMRFCWIPPGKATLGSPATELDRLEHETEHEFELKKGFWMAKYPVTQEQWQAVIGKNPSRFSVVGDHKDDVKGLETSHFPVDQVSYYDCKAFLAKCTRKLRLPHEDEWEYACRGGRGNKRAFYWGDALNGDKANCDGRTPYGSKTAGKRLRRTSEVGAYEKVAPHPWGLCDMSGNVWQWCDNKYDAERSGRILRGGSFCDLPRNCRSAYRFSEGPRELNEYTSCRPCLD